MATYNGPHVAVRQKFQQTPAAAAIENLPPASIGTAYDVFEKEVIGSYYGIQDEELAWPTDNTVVFDSSVIGERGYEFYPVATYSDSIFGDESVETTATETGAQISKDATYTIPGTEVPTGFSSAKLPYYTKLGSSVASVAAEALDIVNVVGGSLVTAGIVAGQSVYGFDGATWSLIGTVGVKSTDETKIKLSTPIAAADVYDGIIVGASTVALKDYSDTLYDPSADFIVDKVAVGDIVEFISTSLGASTYKASVTAIINRNTLILNTDKLTGADLDNELKKYQAIEISAGGTIPVTTYKVTRLVGFSADKNDLDSTAATITTTGVNTIITVDKATLDALVGGSLLVGDVFGVLPAAEVGSVITTSPMSVQMSDLFGYKIETLTDDGTDYTIGTSLEIKASSLTSGNGGAAIVTGDSIYIWRPGITSDVKSDFRAVRSEERLVPTRCNGQQAIIDAYGPITVYNELAFMLSTELLTSGGKVVYGCNVNSAATNLASEYGLALEEMKASDVYSMAFGTTDAGVNALIGPHCDEQSDPYQGHERVGMACYEEEDVFLIGSDSGTASAYNITVASIDPQTLGIRRGDVVSVYDAGVYVQDVEVAQTPTTSVIEVDTDLGTIASAAFTFFVGSNDSKAERIGAIQYGNRRVKVIWPGWFTAEAGDVTQLFPPYYIAAAKAGFDSGDLVSQSQTNRTFAIPGLSNYSLETNQVMNKSQLDEIGGGGVDILIQDVQVSQSIKSRHDLTSNMDSIEFREWSITKQVDVVAKTMRNAVNPYVGRYNITDKLVSFIRTVISNTGRALVNSSVVADITIDTVARDEDIRDKINVVLTVTVFVAGNYYDITLNVKS